MYRNLVGEQDKLKRIEIGRRIRVLRFLNHDVFFINELAKRVGVSHATINNYEYGRTGISPKMMEKLAKVLNTTVEYLQYGMVEV